MNAMITSANSTNNTPTVVGSAFESRVDLTQPFQRNKKMEKNLPVNNTVSAIASSFTFTAQNTKSFPYAGSKAKYLQSFTEVHSKMNTKKVKYYIEGFAGTLASAMHNLQYVEAETIIVNDINEKLINFYSQIQTNHMEVIEKYKLLEGEYNRIIPEELKNLRLIPREKRELFKANESFYKEARALLNSTEPGSNKAALWLFIMNHNFNGLYSENKKGNMNTSFNWCSKAINIKNIESSLNNLHKFFTVNTVLFETLDINDLIDKYDNKDTFIYLDPAYINSEIQYSSKNKKNIEESFAHIARHKNMIEKCSKYRYVLYSNNHNAEFVEIFDSYVNFSRTNSISKNDTTKSKLEILAFKVNEVDIVKPISIIELLGIKTNVTDMVPANKIEHTSDKESIPVAQVLAVPKDITSILNIAIKPKHSNNAS